MDVHGLLTLPSSIILNETTSKAFDLHSRTRLLLDVLDEQSLGTDDLCTNIEVPHALQTNVDALFRPLSSFPRGVGGLLSLTSSEVCNEGTEFLGEELLYGGYSGIQDFLRASRDVEVQRRILIGGFATVW